MLNGKKLGLVLGLFAAFIHLIWIILVALDWAQPFMDFVYQMHSIVNPFTILPFNLGRSILLIVIAFIMGNIVGNLFALFWNKFHK